MCRTCHEELPPCLLFTVVFTFVLTGWFGGGFFLKLSICWDYYLLCICNLSQFCILYELFHLQSQFQHWNCQWWDWTVQDLGQIQMQDRSYYLFSHASPLTASHSTAPLQGCRLCSFKSTLQQFCLEQAQPNWQVESNTHENSTWERLQSHQWDNRGNMSLSYLHLLEDQPMLLGAGSRLEVELWYSWSAVTRYSKVWFSSEQALSWSTDYVALGPNSIIIWF